MIDRFEAVNGEHPGFRRNHAKGVCLTGSFESNGNAARLSTAAGVRARPHAGDRPLRAGGWHADDGRTDRPPCAAWRSSSGWRTAQQWRTGMNDIPVFPMKDPQAFYEQLATGKRDPKTGKPDPAAMKAFLSTHPETAKALGLIKAQPFSSGFANATYNSLNAFLLRRRRGREASRALVDGGCRCLCAGARRVRRPTRTTCSMRWRRA